MDAYARLLLSIKFPRPASEARSYGLDNLVGATAMSKLHYKFYAGIGFVLSPSAVLAASEPEQTITTISEMLAYGSILFVVVIGALVYFARLQDKRMTPLDTLFNERETVHSVAPNTLVTECVRTMTAKKIGALVVMDGERLVGIFTERDALNKVLAAGLEPGKTKVSEVMTKDPYSIPPTTTVGEAMELVTSRRFRHLPIVKNGKVLAVVSSGDLTHWLVKDQLGEVQELVDLAIGS
jgi:CBS domain-containing protein